MTSEGKCRPASDDISVIKLLRLAICDVHDERAQARAVEVGSPKNEREDPARSPQP